MFTGGTNPLSLFLDAYQLDAPVTGGASGVGQTTATVSASVNPEGARTSVAFQFGTTAAYGQSTPAQTAGPDNGADGFSAALSGLPADTTIHYRAVATSDFGTEVGADQTLTTAAPAVVPGRASIGRARVSHTTAAIPVTCRGDTSCTVSSKLTVIETLRGRRIIAVRAVKTKLRHKTVVLRMAKATVDAGHKRTVRIRLRRTGRRWLAARRRLPARLTATQHIAGRTRTISRQKVTFRARTHR